MYKKVKAGDVPGRVRKSESRFEKTTEWQRAKADIDAGLKTGLAKDKRDDSVAKIEITDEDKIRYNIKHRVTIARFVRKYLADNNLPYIVNSFRNENRDFIVVSPRGLPHRRG
jgi:hypothetical protein